MFVRLAGTLLTLLLLLPPCLRAQDTPANPATRRETVRVLLPDGVTPAAAATYFVHTPDERWEKQGTTNAAGRATIEYPTEAPAQFHVIAAEGAVRVPLRESPPGGSDERIVVLNPYGKITVHVYTDDRKPVAGARVIYNGTQAQAVWSGNPSIWLNRTTGPDGTVTYEHLEIGSGRLLLGERGQTEVPPNWMEEFQYPEAEIVQLKREQPELSVELVLKKGVVLRGTVTDGGATPLGDVRVFERQRGYSGETRTDDHGRFSFPGLPLGEVIDLQFASAEYEAPGTVRVDLAKQKEIVFTMARKRAAVLRVTDPGGQPVTRFTSVELGAFYPVPGASIPSALTTESATGELRLPFRKNEKRSLLIYGERTNASPTLPMAARDFNFADATDGQQITIRLGPVYPLSGRVLNSTDGKPMEGARIFVSVRSVRDTDTRGSYMPELAVTGKDGTFRCSEVPAGDVFVHALSPDGFQTEEARVTIMEGTVPPPLEIMMVPNVRLRLRWKQDAVVGGTFTLKNARPYWHLPPGKAGGPDYTLASIQGRFDKTGLYETGGILPGDWVLLRNEPSGPSTLTLRIPASPTAELPVP